MDLDNASCGVDHNWRRALGRARQRDLYAGRLLRLPATLGGAVNPSTLTWTSTGSGKFDVYDEEGWTLLPNRTVLTVDAYVFTGTCGANTERYSPGTGAWTSAGNTPSILADCGNGATFEMGPQVLRPGGTVVAFGGTTCGSACMPGNTTVVTPSAIFNTANSQWSAGPNIPQVGGNNYTLARFSRRTALQWQCAVRGQPQLQCLRPADALLRSEHKQFDLPGGGAH
jgi:hypothetical protein